MCDVTKLVALVVRVLSELTLLFSEARDLGGGFACFPGLCPWTEKKMFHGRIGSLHFQMMKWNSYPKLVTQ